MNRILVIRGGAIGDFVLTLPAIKLLRDKYPQARLEILGYRHITALGEKRFYADALRSLESGPLARFFARDAVLPDVWVDYFASFDLVVSFLFDPDAIFERNVRRCGVETFLACSPLIRAEGEHATSQLAHPLRELDLVLADGSAQLFPLPADREFAQTSFASEAAIAFHPGSGSPSKNWPLENWLALLEQPQFRNSSIVLVGGEADRAQLQTLRALSRDNFRFAENLPLPHLAAVLERCRLFLGHDSGISHLAAAVGTPSLLLFGPTDPKIWAPLNKNVHVARAKNGQLAKLKLEEIGEKIDALMS
ncbi:MAG: glycosyltransferase family 9 protein [Chthoniobacterales bacterium]